MEDGNKKKIGNCRERERGRRTYLWGHQEQVDDRLQGSSCRGHRSEAVVQSWAWPLHGDHNHLEGYE